MFTFFERKESVNKTLMENIDQNLIDSEFLNSFGNNPAFNKDLQPHPGFLATTLLKQNKESALHFLLNNEAIKNRHQFITVKVYLKILATKNESLIAACKTLLENCAEEKYKTLLLHESIGSILRGSLATDPRLQKKVLHAWQQINLDELLILHQFLKLQPQDLESRCNNLAHFFKGGLFAVQDGGRLRAYLEEKIQTKDRSKDCSHPSISKQRSSQGKLLPEFLFGDRNISFNEEGEQQYNVEELSEESYTWFQAEYASLFGETAWDKVKNYLSHKLCFIIYWLTQKNVGPYGLSEYKEQNILILDQPSLENSYT